MTMPYVTTIKCRVEQLKAMDAFMPTVNREVVLEEWLSYGVPDGGQEEYYEDIAGDDEAYGECVRIFRRMVKDDDCYY